MPVSWRRRPSSGGRSTRYATFWHRKRRPYQFLQALQLLEYLVKNGSERVVDDARSHIATIKMLRNFYYIDEKGKDQGLNGRLTAHQRYDALLIPRSTEPLEGARRAAL